MKNLFELRRSSKLKYKPSKEELKEYHRAKGKKKAKEEYKKALNKKRVICRVLPSIVADNFDIFIELVPNASVYDVNTEALRVRGELLSKK